MRPRKRTNSDERQETKTGLSVVFLWTSWIPLCTLRDTLHIIIEVSLVSVAVRTLAHVPRYYIGTPTKNSTCYFQICRLPWSSDKKRHGIYHPGGACKVCYKVRSDHCAQWSQGRAIPNHCGRGWEHAVVRERRAGPCSYEKYGDCPSSLERVMAAHRDRKANKDKGVPSSRVTAMLRTSKRNHSPSLLLSRCRTEEVRSSALWPIVVLWREQTLSALSQIAWPNGQTDYSHRLSRQPSFHWRMH